MNLSAFVNKANPLSILVVKAGLMASKRSIFVYFG
jgi:hypothetical protein